MNVERLLLVAEIVEKVPPEQFDMIRDWDCGTTACAIGWACRDRRVLDTGLHMSAYDSIGGSHDRFLYPVFEKQTGISGIATWADIAEDDVDELFGGVSEYNTPNEVAGHIRQFVKENQT